MKLVVKFWRIENVVLAKVLEQEGIERGVFEESKNNFRIKSNLYPDINNQTLYIRGTMSRQDNSIARATFNSIENAINYIKNISAVIREINSEGTQTESMDDIEITIAR